MCLAVPGQVVAIESDATGENPMRIARVDFQGSRLSASLVFVPDAKVGDWILVHAGYAIQQLSESDARRTWRYLDEAERAEIADAARETSTSEPSQSGGAR